MCFVAEDDLWLAPLPAAGPGHTAKDRAWRLTVDRTRVGPPRFSPDGRHIAFTSWRTLDPEIHLAPVDGGPVRQLTHWASYDTRVRGWTPPDASGESRVLAIGSHEQPFSHFARAYTVPTAGGPGEQLPWGPVSDIAVRGLGAERRTLLLTGSASHDPADWKRYRGGGMGRLWLHGERLLADLGGQLNSPMFVGDRIAFLSDHEGVGNLYSCRPDGSQLWRHTDHDAFYARHASTDGHRVVYQCAGELWLLDDLGPGSVPRRLPLRLGGPRTGRRPYQVHTAAHVDALTVDTTGRASAICVRGGLYWLTHRDGPARALAEAAGVRVRLPEILGDSGRIAYITDAEGEDAIEIAHLPRVSGGREPVRLATGPLGRVRELIATPDGTAVAVATHDGRLLLVRLPDDGAASGGEGNAHGGEAAETAGEAGPAGNASGGEGNAHGEEGAGTTGEAGAAGGSAGGSSDGDASGGNAGASSGSAGGVRTASGQAAEAAEAKEEADAREETVAEKPVDGPAGPGTSETDSPADADGENADAAAGASGAAERVAGDDPGDTDAAAQAAALLPRVTEVARSVNGPVRDLAFSPDSRWLAWAHPGIGRSLSQIRIAELSGETPTVLEVTDGRFEDEEPVFTSDGRFLAFLSWRGFDPVYDVHTGGLSFPLGCRPYLVPLSSATRSPFAITPEGRPAAGGLDPDEAGGDGDTEAEGRVTVEAEGLGSRVTPFPVAASKYSSLYPVSGGGLVWLRWPISGALGETFLNPDDTSGKPTLEHFDLAKAKRSELASEVDWFVPSGDGTRLVISEDQDLSVVSATDATDSDAAVRIDLRRIVHVADPAAEWRQSFDEAGRLVRDYFWDPGMCGIDWSAVLDQYRPLVERVASPDEFADLLMETMGELGTSHAYVSAGRFNEGPWHYQRPQGLLGANFCRTKDGSGWQLSRVLPGDSSDSKARSPLAGTGVRESAVLTHVGGRPVDPAAGPWPLLAGTGGTSVELTFADESGRQRRVAVVPLVDDRQLRYQDWVARRRELVRELSGGRCGYVHIPDMGGSGWAQFNRDLRREFDREALIVDVRGNAGGHISELVVEKLSRTILGWDLTRNAQPVSYTSNAPRGPVVAIADEATSSDGDMITAAFRLLGIGPVVGSRTWGGVVGITGEHRLGDGTEITVPMNAAWFDAYGWDVENHGVTPDIEALRTPLDWAEGRSVMLDTAVRVALDLLERHPAAKPPGYQRIPDRSRPPLPPRTAAPPRECEEDGSV
ncbi:peptidase S41 [Streptomyces triticirhizae]|uniref:Peptidase S41 n=1 Tax=Streptomyces triticirhizae TaxID=2483353 RepID=A0A3M2LHQ9_9ACTN|nr:S41 family peptidase [Streptomyces triticirhizae]RMI36656.1 peptidase S41 [Streptomyces triticirhizae]